MSSSLHDELVAACVGCDACDLRRERLHDRPVVWRGSLEADVMFVGEAPGADEAEQGVPFVGVSGQLLQEGIEHLCPDGRYYVTNVIKDRPPGNRDPSPDEIAACLPFLQLQIRIVRPLMIVTVGRVAFSALVPGTRLKITRDKVTRFECDVDGTPMPVYPVLHPSYVLRNRRSMLSEYAGDFEVLRKVLARLRGAS